MRIRLAVSSILLLGFVAGFFSAGELLPESVRVLRRPYRLGLDLLGGTHLVYRADFSAFRGQSRSEAMAGLRDVIERRVNLFGVAEPVVQVLRAGDDWRLIVELAGVRDIAEAIRQIGKTPFLEFREARSEEETKTILAAWERGERTGEDPYFVPSLLTGQYLARAELQFDSTTNAPLIGVSFNAEGESLLAALTERNIGKPIGIYLDGALLSAPIVREQISGGKAQITGQFTVPEARELVRNLNAGALPVPISLLSQQSVGASLGEDTLSRSLSAGLFGFAAVSLFMLLWYRLPGLVAVIALLSYVAFVLSLFKLIPVTLTAAGIAGFILSVGMAVDANVLIFERMKEELLLGRNLGEAIGEGFSRAWTSIRDSNVTTIISAAILFWFGTSIVQGFALTLGIGVVISMLTAITVSRTFLLAVVTPRLERYRWLFLSGIARSNK